MSTASPVIGLYEIPEVARYLHMTSRLESPFRPDPSILLRWVRQGLASPDLVKVPGHQLLIGFEDLISLRVISFLRAIGVSLQKVRTAELYLRGLTGHSRPLATEKLWTEAVDIFAENSSLLFAASKSGQLPFPELVREHLVNVHDMTFNSRGIANSWLPTSNILLRPDIQFGEPCIAKTGIPTKAIWRMFIDGDSITFIAQSYEIDEELVQRAIEWEARLARITFGRAKAA